MWIQKKIKDALSEFIVDGTELVIQFWSPTPGCQKLSTVDQPFFLDQQLDTLRKYRLSSLHYNYSIDNDNIAQDDEESRSFGIPVATAFLDCSPHVIMNPRVVVECCCTPLLRSALQCGLIFFVTNPVFLNSSVVGVLECSRTCSFDLLLLFNNLKTALKSVGLDTYQIPPYETIPGVTDAKHEGEEALQLVCASLDIPVAQVWIPYENESNHTILSNTRAVGYFNDSGDAHMHSMNAYYVTCATLPLNTGDGLAGKTLQTYEPHFCRDVYELRVNGVLGMIYEKAKFICFVICSRNINTGNLDYAFEFLWPRSRSYLILLESLLVTLKRGLPSFRFAFGAQLDDELRVLDVENSTGSGIGSFKILEKNRLSHIPKALDVGRKSVVEDCISSSEVKFKTTSIPLPQVDIRQQTESQGSNFVVKRKLSDLNQEDNRANQENGVHRTLFYLPSNKKKYKYNLGPSSYNLQFLDFEKERRMMDVDRASKYCIKSRRTAGVQSIAQLITPCLKRAWREIEEALVIVCESHHINLAQVWIPYENDKPVPCSSAVKEPQTKQLFAVKLTGYSVDSNGGHSASLKEYYDTCDGLRLKIGDGLSGKALQTYEPHFCKNIYELDDNGLLPANTESSCLAICLRSIHTGDLDYAFEFLWPHTRFYLFVLKSLFATLNRCLPNFKFASGAQLSDEISSLKRFYPSDKAATGIRPHDASHGNTSPSQIPNALKETRRLSTDLHESQETFESVACMGDYELTIEAAYGDDHGTFYLHSSSKLADVEKNIDENYTLGPRSYRLEYRLECGSDDLWVMLDDDEAWNTCIKVQKLFGHQTIRLHVLSEN